MIKTYDAQGKVILSASNSQGRRDVSKKAHFHREFYHKTTEITMKMLPFHIMHSCIHITRLSSTKPSIRGNTEVRKVYVCLMIY
jgi:hypothetical protein